MRSKLCNIMMLTRYLYLLLLPVAVQSCVEHPRSVIGQSHAAPALRFERLLVQSTQSDGTSAAALVGNRKVVLMHPDNSDNPKAWEGPLKIIDMQTRSHCESDISLIAAAYASRQTDYLVVVAYSGSLHYVHFIDQSTCRDLWPRLELFTDGITVSGDLLTAQPACECADKGIPCQCSAGKVFRFETVQPPTLLRSESLALTKKALGVGFEGQGKVLHPKMDNAQIVHP